MKKNSLFTKFRNADLQEEMRLARLRLENLEERRLLSVTDLADLAGLAATSGAVESVQLTTAANVSDAAIDVSSVLKTTGTAALDALTAAGIVYDAYGATTDEAVIRLAITQVPSGQKDLCIEGFANLTELSANDCALTSLDVSALTNLKRLQCRNSNLTTLDLGSDTNLGTLWCDGNNLTTLDLSGVASLTDLYCYNNNLTTLDLSANASLRWLQCHDNNLTALDLSVNTRLEYISCYDNNLTTLDVSGGVNLYYLYCFNNNLTTLNLNACTKLGALTIDYNVESLSVRVGLAVKLMNLPDEADVEILDSSNVEIPFNYTTNSFILPKVYSGVDDPIRLTTNTAGVETQMLIYPRYLTLALDALTAAGIKYDAHGATTDDGVSKLTITSVPGGNLTLGVFPNLIGLVANNCSLTGLDVSNLTNLSYLNCDNNNLTTLDLSANTSLRRLDCYDNDLTTLDVSANTSLITLSCSYNNLTTLDLSSNTSLTYLFCNYNSLVTLDVSACTSLKRLECIYNDLVTLNLSANPSFTYLSCSYNYLTTLDVSANTGLTDLWCYTNYLRTLDVSANTSLTTLICWCNFFTTLDLSANTRLETLGINYNLPTLIAGRPDDVISVRLANLPDGAYVQILDSSDVEIPFDSNGNTFDLPIVDPGAANPIRLTTYAPDFETQMLINPVMGSTALDALTAAGIVFDAHGATTDEEVVCLTITHVPGGELCLGAHCLGEFANLTELNVNSCALTSLDVSAVTNLRALCCSNNNLTTLDLGANTQLESLLIDYNLPTLIAGREDAVIDVSLVNLPDGADVQIIDSSNVEIPFVGYDYGYVSFNLPIVDPDVPNPIRVTINADGVQTQMLINPIGPTLTVTPIAVDVYNTDVNVAVADVVTTGFDNPTITVDNASFTIENNQVVFVGGASGTYALTVTASEGDVTQTETFDVVVNKSKLAAPTGLTYTATSSSITFNWTAVPNATGYAVVFNGAAYTTGANSYTATGLASDTEYAFSVRATAPDMIASDSASLAARTLEAAAAWATLSTDSPIFGSSVVVSIAPGSTATYAWYSVDSNNVETKLSYTTARCYVASNNLLGKRLKAVVTYTGGEFAGQVVSVTTANAVARQTPPVTIATSVPYVGKDIYAYVSLAMATVDYQWYRVTAEGVEEAIPGATTRVYTPVVADVGFFLKIVATGTGDYVGSTFATTEAPITLYPLSLSTLDPILGGRIHSDLTPPDSCATFQWQTYDEPTESWVDIAGATYGYFTPSYGQLGKQLRLIATYQRFANKGLSFDVVTNPVTRPISSITISGDTGLQAGSQLTTAVVYKYATADYQWYRGETADGDVWTAIDGATAKTYTVSDADKGYYLKVVATGTGDFSGVVEAVTAESVYLERLSFVTGEYPLLGERVRVALNPNDPATYVWSFVDGQGVATVIPNATLSYFTPTYSYVGNKLRVAATYQSGEFAGQTFTLDTADVVKRDVSKMQLTISPDAACFVGDVLSANIVPSTATVAYQWYRVDAINGTETLIAGATSSSYTTTAADAGFRMKVAATGTGLFSGVVEAATAESVYSEPLTFVTGEYPLLGERVRVALNPVASATYVWSLVDAQGVATVIPNATSGYFTPSYGHVGYKLRVAATYQAGEFTGQTFTLDTADVVKRDVSKMQLSISPDAACFVGDVLSANIVPSTATVAYQWYRVDAVNGTETAIAGATNSSYATTAADEGFRMKVAATGTGLFAGVVEAATAESVCPKRLSFVTGEYPLLGERVRVALNPVASATYVWSLVDNQGVATVIPNATLSYFTPSYSQVGYKLRVAATYQAGEFTGQTFTLDTADVVKRDVSKMQLSISPGSDCVVGDVLSASIVPSNATVAYQWYRVDAVNGTETLVDGATSSSYATTAADEGFRMKVVATGVNLCAGTKSAITSYTIGAGSAAELDEDVFDLLALSILD